MIGQQTFAIHKDEKATPNVFSPRMDETLLLAAELLAAAHHIVQPLR
jgi:hypothetical protein